VATASASDGPHTSSWRIDSTRGSTSVRGSGESSSMAAAATVGPGAVNAWPAARSSATEPSYSWKFFGHSSTACLNRATASPCWRSNASSAM